MSLAWQPESMTKHWQLRRAFLLHGRSRVVADLTGIPGHLHGGGPYMVLPRFQEVQNPSVGLMAAVVSFLCSRPLTFSELFADTPGTREIKIIRT